MSPLFGRASQVPARERLSGNWAQGVRKVVVAPPFSYGKAP